MDDHNLRRRTLKPAAEEAGVPWVGFHSFRHTTASMLISEGRNIVQVSRWLGHHSPSFTLDVYAHLMDEGVGDALHAPNPREYLVMKGPRFESGRRLSNGTLASRGFCRR
jgi:integrase